MINYAITLSLLIAVVILLRAVFRKKVPQRLIYTLWLVVFIKMCLPFSFIALDIPALPSVYPNSLGSVTVDTSTVFSTEVPQISTPITDPITNPITRPPVSSQLASPVTDKITAPVTQPSHITEKPTVTAPPITAAPAVTEEIKKPISASPSETVITQSPPPAAEPKQNVFDLGKTLLTLSVLGSIIVGSFFGLSAVLFSSKLREDRIFVRKEGRISVYISQNARTPCVFGIVPKIYLTPAAAESDNAEIILRHELTHIRHGDTLWAIVRIAALIIFWYNPFVWAAAILSRRDAELACDEALAAELDTDGRIRYAHTILDCIPEKKGNAVGLSSAPIKERLIMLTQKSKTSVICIILALTLTLGAAGCSFIGSKPQTPDAPDDGKVSDDTTEPEDTDEPEDTTTEPDDTPAEPPELSEELKLEIQKAYVESHNKNNPDKPITQEDVWVFGYRGEYSGAHVVTIHVSGYFYPAEVTYITVNGEKIWYGSTQPDVYKDGEFYGIEYAFEKGILSAEDIKALAD